VTVKDAILQMVNYYSGATPSGNSDRPSAIHDKELNKV